MMREILGSNGHCLLYLQDADNPDLSRAHFVATERCNGPVMVSTTLNVGNTKIVWRYCGECIALATTSRMVTVQELPFYMSWHHDGFYDELLAHGEPPPTPIPNHDLTAVAKMPEILQQWHC